MGVTLVTDHKYDRSIDRQVTLFDYKSRLIDLLTMMQSLPETDIYDEPVRYFKANLKWTPIIFGWLDVLEDVSGWHEAADDNYAGIQQILKFEEGIEPIMTTPAEMQTAITEGIYKAVNDIAKQIVSGSRTNFSVDEDGNLVPPSAGDVPLPPDDPLTPIDDSKAASAGGMIAIASGINAFIAYVDLLFGPTQAPVTPLAEAQTLVSLRFMPSSLMDAAISAYYDDRIAGQGELGILVENDLAEFLFCDHASDTTLQSFNRFISYHATMTLEDKFRYTELIPGLEDTQFSIWYNAGIKVPSTNYLAYSCVPIPDYNLTIQWQGGAVNDTHTLKKRHRYLVTVLGHLVDTDGDIQDAFWTVNAATGIKTFNTSDFNIQIGQAVKIDPTIFEADYASDHLYAWTVDMGGINANPQWGIVRNAIMSVGSTSPSNGLFIQVHDLGEII
jgi:hypothetical protein